ncbi:MAG: hypothetical protein WCJ70_03270 [bacterium]
MGLFRLLSIGTLLAYLSVMTFINLRFDQTPKPAPVWCVCRPANGDDPTKGTWIKSSFKAATGEWCDVDEYIGTCNPQTDFMPITTEMMRPSNLSLFVLDMIRSAYLMLVGSIAGIYIALNTLYFWQAKNNDEKKIVRAKIIGILPEVITICLLVALVIYIEKVVYHGYFCMGISCYPHFPGN